MNDLIGRVEGRLDDLSRQMLDGIVERVPLYGQLPAEQLEGEILDICRANLDFFLASLRDAGRPSAVAMAAVKASAARRAEERVPLEAVLVAYQVGGQVAWAALQETAGPGDVAELVDLAGALMTYMSTMTGAVSDAYVEERGAIATHQREARRSLLEALLRGDPGEPPERWGTRVVRAPDYIAVAMSMSRSGDEADAAVAQDVASRRKVRRAEDFLVNFAGDGTLCRLDAAGGIVLIPAVAGGTGAAAAGIPDLMEALSKEADADVWAGMAWGDGSGDVRDHVDEASQVLRLAQGLGRPPGSYVLDDVVLEFVVAASGAGRDHLAGLLEVLEDGPDLIPTLATWFASDFDRRRAAETLHVHPNTLDYRLRRVVDLTGLNPGSARGVQLLGAALLARDLQAGDVLS